MQIIRIFHHTITILVVTQTNSYTSRAKECLVVKMEKMDYEKPMAIDLNSDAFTGVAETCTYGEMFNNPACCTGSGVTT